ncbi:GMP synthase-like glutamine amidotransferase [Methylobacterium sp. BE186]|uniref:type 1 glutamine amidotransferase n=1 Tax=Methylobacterium sp. BE186 TaxID=2817715 RepID=UPI0028622DFD|nr:type 1 glutamine amidotransferase [Methylobacterium sp. BE186]MDR7037134.1 GMP synthase-like glutamine amidotransferase [Methylobacterium sp. BE186]
MKIAVLETGRPPARLGGRYPGYGEMVRSLVGPGHAYETFLADSGVLPVPNAHAGYLITGSPAGIYDPDPWIAALIAFLRALAPERRVVGICFGHQVMAQAWGGRVVKSEKGWGLGLHRYEVVEPAPFMDGGDAIRVPASHQDQVVALPPGARVLAASAFTPYAVLGYRDRAALSFQCHPEFEPAFARALTEGHRAAESDPARAAAALASLDGPHDSGRVGGWIRRFLDDV